MSKSVLPKYTPIPISNVEKSKLMFTTHCKLIRSGKKKLRGLLRPWNDMLQILYTHIGYCIRRSGAPGINIFYVGIIINLIKMVRDVSKN